MLQELFSKKIVVISDPIPKNKLFKGDNDDWLLIYYFYSLFKSNLTVYIPYVIKAGTTHYLSVKDDFEADGIKVVTESSEDLEKIVLEADIIGYMAPLSNADSTLLKALFNRENNSLNFSQGQIYNETTKGPDYNFLASNVSSWRIGQKDFDVDFIKELFPTQYKSSSTNKSTDIENIFSLIPDVSKHKNIIVSCAICNCFCPPSNQLAFTMGLYCPKVGKGNNMKKLINFSHDNFETHFYFNEGDSNEKLMETIIEFASYINLSDEQEKFIEDWIDIWINRFGKHDFRSEIFSSIKILYFLLLKLNIDIKDGFPKFEEIDLQKFEGLKFPRPAYFDLVCGMGYVYGTFKGNLNLLNEKEIPFDFLIGFSDALINNI